MKDFLHLKIDAMSDTFKNPDEECDALIRILDVQEVHWTKNVLRVVTSSFCHELEFITTDDAHDIYTQILNMITGEEDD